MVEHTPLVEPPDVSVLPVVVADAVALLVVVDDAAEPLPFTPRRIGGVPSSCAPTSGPLPAKPSLKFGSRAALSWPGVPGCSE